MLTPSKRQIYIDAAEGNKDPVKEFSFSGMPPYLLSSVPLLTTTDFLKLK